MLEAARKNDKKVTGVEMVKEKKGIFVKQIVNPCSD